MLYVAFVTRSTYAIFDRSVEPLISVTYVPCMSTYAISNIANLLDIANSLAKIPMSCTALYVFLNMILPPKVR